MNTDTALLHLPALLLFYALQYFVLKAHLPQAAPWIALGSLLVVALLYLIARLALRRSSPGGQLLLGSYAALVLFHAGYLNAVPTRLGPWVGLALLSIALLARRSWRLAGAGLSPLLLAVGCIFLLNLLQIISGGVAGSVPGHRVLGVIYAAMLYLGYVLTRGEPALSQYSGVLLYTGHISAMSATGQLLHERITQSVAWALLALVCLGWAVARRDRLVGQSSLLLFGATAFKVLLYDLQGAPPLTRIVSLVVLGIAFYVGGLLYQRVAAAGSASRA